MSILFLVVGLAMLVIGAEWLVRGATSVGQMLRLTPLVIGLTIVGFGTSSPELAVGVNSAWVGASDIAVGNVLGSNVFNIFVILGISAIILPLGVQPQLLRLDVPLLIVISIIVAIISTDGLISKMEGGCLLFGLVVYTLNLARLGRKAESTPKSDSIENSISVKKFATSVGLIGIGLAFLVVGSRLFVGGAIVIAKLSLIHI